MSKSAQMNNDGCCDSCQPNQSSKEINDHNSVLKYWPPIVSFLLLAAGLIFEHALQSAWFSDPLRFIWYLAAYLPVGLPVLKDAAKYVLNGDLFTEFFLMGLATVGAFYIGEYAEGVAVMLFYTVGELFQHRAVHNARENIKSLLDVRPETADVIRDNDVKTVNPRHVEIGERIRVKPGERVPLDGKLVSGKSAFDTSALTGESKPRHFSSGDSVLYGMVKPGCRDRGYKII